MSITSAPRTDEALARLAGKRAVVAVAILIGVLGFFLTQTRLTAMLGKLPTLDQGASGRNRSAFSHFFDPATFPDPLQWIAYGINLWDANAVGMFFAILLGGAAMVAISPQGRVRRLLARQGRLGAGVGGGMGLPLFMCSACSAPVSLGFYRGGAALEATLAMMLGSALLNPVGLLAIFLLMPTSSGSARVAFALLMIFAAVPLVARAHRRRATVAPSAPCAEDVLHAAAPARDLSGPDTWANAVREALRGWWRHTSELAVRLVPAMLVAGFAVGGVFTIASPQGLSDIVGSGVVATVLAAGVGTLVQVPTLFEIPLVLGVLALGLGIGPATALLLTVPSTGLVTLGIVRQDLGWRTPGLMLLTTFAGGVVAGLAVGAL
ncbi:MAG: permease [Thermoleophilaceae bacterium]|nr:permease [Thermoleophilaceae bacterium]